MINIPETPEQSIYPIDPIAVVEGDMHNYENPKKRLKRLLIIIAVIIIGFVGVFRLITGTWLGAKAEEAHSSNPYFAECEPDITLRPTLRKGAKSDAVNASNGPCVMALQRALNDCCGNNLTEDGWLGSVTNGAIINFQKFFGLTVDGVVGPQTWAGLDYISSISERNLATPDSPFLSPQEVWDQAHAEGGSDDGGSADDSGSADDGGSADDSGSADGGSADSGGSADGSADGSSDGSGQDTSNSDETPTQTPVDTPSSSLTPTEPEPYQADPANCITIPELNTGTNDNDCVAKMQEIIGTTVDGDYGEDTELAVSKYAEDRCLNDSENGKKWVAFYWIGTSSCLDDNLDLAEPTSEDGSSADGSSDDSGQDASNSDESFPTDSDLTEPTSEDGSSADGSSDDSGQDASSSDATPTSPDVAVRYELTAKETLAKIKCGLTSNDTYSYVYYKHPRYVCTESNRLSNILTDVAYCDLQHRTTSGKFSTTLNGSCTVRRTIFTPASPLSSIYNRKSNGK